jgi:hypothetical protein
MVQKMTTLRMNDDLIGSHGQERRIAGTRDLANAMKASK